LHAERFVLSPFVGGQNPATVFSKALGNSPLNPKLKGLITTTDVVVEQSAPSSGLVSATVCGTVLVKSDAGEWRDVPLAALGNPVLTDIGARFRATQDYATQNGFAGGFPTFFDADRGAGIVCGTILLRPESAVLRDVLLWLGPA
jgi:hypothetical protein